MDTHFAMFNCHANDAEERANAEFTAQFGQEAFDTEIQPILDAGIMSIFDGAPTSLTAAYAALVTAYVNEGRE